MLRNSAALSIALLVCTLMLPMETAAAQQAGKTGLHDDTSGRLTQIPIRKENLAFADASADLTFDVDYVYKSTTLVGEPLLLCGAKLSNPKGTVSFTHRGETHQVAVTPQNAEKINPHHLDLLVEYRLPHSRVVYASCDTGIVGTWAREAYNLSSSPSWGRFLCELGAPIVIAHYVSTRPRPNRIDREWCASMQGRYLEADAAKELFRGRELRASGFVVASLSLDVADLVLERTRTALAERIAQRMQAQLEGALNESKPGMLASSEERETWEALNSEVRTRLDAAAATETATERARALREAIRTVLAAEGSDDGSTETLRAVQQALAGRLSAEAEREFAEDEREEAGRLQGERDRTAGDVEAQLAAAREAVQQAPDFAFLSSRFLMTSACGANNEQDWWLVNDDGACLAGPFVEESKFVLDLASVRFRKERENWYIDRNGRKLYGPYSNSWDFHESGYAVSQSMGKNGVIDTNGNTVIPHNYIGIQIVMHDHNEVKFIATIDRRHQGECGKRIEISTVQEFNSQGKIVSQPYEQQKNSPGLCLFLQRG